MEAKPWHSSYRHYQHGFLYSYFYLTIPSMDSHEVMTATFSSRKQTSSSDFSDFPRAPPPATAKTTQPRASMFRPARALRWPQPVVPGPETRSLTNNPRNYLFLSFPVTFHNGSSTSTTFTTHTPSEAFRSLIIRVLFHIQLRNSQLSSSY